jgi:hypothetical protein
MNHVKTLVLRCHRETLEALAPLAREGLGVDIRPGQSLRRTMEIDLGFCPACVEERIQTVFLDGSPVDDIDNAAASPGCTLALAAAMPGVAGIAMRRGSPVGAFREGVTHHASTPAGSSHADGPARQRITLKLFNFVAVECLAWVLEQGAEVPAVRLAEVLEERSDEFAGAGFECEGRTVSFSGATAALRETDGPVRLKALL